MKYLSIVIFLFLMSCVTPHKTKHKPGGEGSFGGEGGSLHKDSISVNLSDSELVNSINEIHNQLISNPTSPKPKQTLKIITIHNTKIISQSKDMSEGRVVYKIPSEMKIRSTYQVLLRISKSKATLSIYDSLQGEVRTSEIPVTQTMQVSLIDPSPKDDKAFDIIPDNNGIQVVDSGDTYTQWTWNVTPIKVGNSKLKITISIVRDGKPKDVVYEDIVDVGVDIPAQILFFWNKWWQWIIGTFISPFIIWFYKKRKDEKDDIAKKKVSDGGRS